MPPKSVQLKQITYQNVNFMNSLIFVYDSEACQSRSVRFSLRVSAQNTTAALQPVSHLGFY